MRIEITAKPAIGDGRALRLLHSLERASGKKVHNVRMADVYLLHNIGTLPDDMAREIFLDSVAQDWHCDKPVAGDEKWTWLLEVAFKAGVTNPEAITAKEAVHIAVGHSLPEGAIVQTARQYLFVTADMDEVELRKLTAGLFNPLIQQATIISRKQWDEGVRLPELYPAVVPPSQVKVERIDLVAMNDAALMECSRQRLLALTLDEMQCVRAYFSDPAIQREREQAGIGAQATDVELEMIAQTWSEHCKHKIFNATVDFQDEQGNRREIRSIFKQYIKAATAKVSKKRKDLRSVFHDNSGMVDFDGKHVFCMKVETHNSPSALDPYGGAITGIVGVNRDILGTGLCAKPIFNTNVLCFGEPDTAESEIPKKLLHPRQVLSGVHHGIVDGGNQSGIPVAGGAFLFDKSFTGKPLVFCGTAGFMPSVIRGRKAWEKRIDHGDLAVMVGGRIGKDGIHGATFSSTALDEESPTSAVQIGDPIIQKRMTDFLLEARDRNLFRALTDNGAGGLSSSLGEMGGIAGGIEIWLDKCPLKYPGLAPWEILVSESQERMSVAVPPADIDAFLELAARRDVEASVVGAFSGSGRVVVKHGDQLVVDIGLEFLHDGLPDMRLPAIWKAPVYPDEGGRIESNLLTDIVAVLSEPNVASKEPLVRQYDHEVQAGSVIKPFCGVQHDAPSDGGVFRPVYRSKRGISVTHGICPRVSDHDTRLMAMLAMDEAYRAHIALGGDPDKASALDNFCWPDPVQSASAPDGAYKMAQLVRACEGLYDACVAYNVPLISGKDSMKNDAILDGKKVSVKPTLLVTITGIVPDVANATSTDFKKRGDVIYLAGEPGWQLGASIYEKIKGVSLGPCPDHDLEKSARFYRAMAKVIRKRLVASCHDCSEGGLVTALVESALGGRLGARISLNQLAAVTEDKASNLLVERILFSESGGRFLVSVSPEKTRAFEKALQGYPLFRLGEVGASEAVSITLENEELVRLGLDAAESAWKEPARSVFA